MERIVIAVDGSASAQEAVELGVELAVHERAKVDFVHVVPLADIVSTNGFGLVGHVRYEPTELDQKVLEDAKAVADGAGVEAKSALLRGEPVIEIVAYADAVDADLVVVGPRGHGAIASALLGSVSRGVLTRSKRPVLVVRTAPVREPVTS